MRVGFDISRNAPASGSRHGETLFIDARNLGTMVDRTHKELTADDIAKTYHPWRGELVSFDSPSRKLARVGESSDIGSCIARHIAVIDKYTEALRSRQHHGERN